MPQYRGEFQYAIMCPFFKNESREKREIICEGPVMAGDREPIANIKLSFQAGEQKRRDHIQRYCCDLHGCESCPVYETNRASWDRMEARKIL